LETFKISTSSIPDQILTQKHHNRSNAPFPSTAPPPPPLSQHAQRPSARIPKPRRRRRRGINWGPLWCILPHLFLDDAPSFHGDLGQHLLYSSPRYGDLNIMVPSYPILSEKSSEEIAAGQAKPDGSVNQVDEGRKPFAHFLAFPLGRGNGRCTPPGETETEARKETRSCGVSRTRVYSSWALVSGLFPVSLAIRHSLYCTPQR
jgi:hypothetical protein